MRTFNESLALSHSFSDAEWWELIYRKAFRNFVSMTDLRALGWWQMAGIDRAIQLSNSKQILVDEKVRTKDYDDILLERWSDKDKKKPGWIQKDLACDYIAYAFVPSKTCYLLPFQLLRRMWIERGRKWCEEYPLVHAKNQGYVTESVAIPIEDLMEYLKVAMIVNW